MKIESIIFCVLYGLVATGVMYVGHNIVSKLMDDLKRQDKEEPDK